jgi:hypothetical protein
MHTNEIREVCYRCGNHETRPTPGRFSTDFCKFSQQDCSAILTCDPVCRIPKKTKWWHGDNRRKNKWYQIKKEPLDSFVTPEDPTADPDEEQERDPPLNGDQE